MFLVSFLQVSLAFEPSIRFERLSVEDGLPQSSANSVLQDSQGFLWVGTQDGLARYDGYNFKVFKHNADNPYSLSANYIEVIFEDSQGTIWVGTFGGGLNRFNPKTEQFSHYRFNATNSNSLSNDIVNTIIEDHQGVLWLGTRGGGLNRFNPKTEQFIHYRFNTNNPYSLSNDHVLTIIEDHQGTIWIGTRSGVNRFDPKTEQFSHYRFDANNPSSLSNDHVLTIIEDHQGMLWVGTHGGGLNRFNPKTEQFSHYPFDASNPNNLSDNVINAMVEDHQGILWLGTRGGVNRFDPKSKKFSPYRYDLSNPHSLSNDSVWTLYEDHQGAIWVGTADGLNRFNPESEQFSHYQSDASNPNSLSNDTVWAITENQQKALWIGTTGGLNRFNPKTMQFSHYRFDASNPNSLSHNFVKSIAEDQQGTLWVGTYRGLDRFNPQTEQFSHYRFDADNPNSLSNNFVKAITEDQQGMLWLGTTDGLNRFNPKTEHFSHYRFDASNPNSLTNNNVVAITEDQAGMIWLGTDGGGLNRFNPKTEQFTHYRFDANTPTSLSIDVVYAITEDHQGSLWVGTSNGLNLMDKQSGQFKHFTEKDGLPNNVIYSIEEDNNGLLWLSTNQGLSRFNPTTKRFKNYDVEDGLQSNEFNIASSFKNKRGELFFGGINGLNRFFPDKVIDDNQKPAVVFTDMLLLNQSVPIRPKQNKQENTAQSSNNRFTLEQAIHSTKVVTLSHQENLVSFEFSALHFSNPKKNQYAYRLEGFDTDWITTDYKNRRATYTNLPSGDYVLRVKASNSDGVWNEEGASLNIIVLPPPWKSWWAYSSYSAILIGLLFVFIRIQRNKVLFERKLSAQLEHKVAERTTELQEAYTQLEKVSLTDQLTGLNNRRYLLNNIDNDIALVARESHDFNRRKEFDKSDVSDLIFFLIDLDHFKQVNDIYGHSAGDAVLMQIKTILEQVFRKTDYLIRWGGEEFLVIARFTDRNSAAELAERLRQTVENHNFDIGEGKVLKKTCSIGFASYPFILQEPTVLEWTRVVDVADHCLYAAKKSGRNTWVGLDGTAISNTDDLFTRITNQTQNLIKSKELQMFTSISAHKNVVW